MKNYVGGKAWKQEKYAHIIDEGFAWTVRPYLEYSEKDNPENESVVYGDAVSYCLNDFKN